MATKEGKWKEGFIMEMQRHDGNKQSSLRDDFHKEFLDSRQSAVCLRQEAPEGNADATAAPSLMRCCYSGKHSQFQGAAKDLASWKLKLGILMPLLS